MVERDQRTEKATPKRREEARAEGQVAQSQELGHALSLLIGLFLLSFLGSMILGAMRTSLQGLGRLDAFDFSDVDVIRLLRREAWNVARSLVPFVLLLLPSTALISYLQVGFRVTPKRIRWNPARLDPVKGFGKLLSARSLARALFATFKLVLILGLVAWVVRDAVPGLTRLDADRDVAQFLTTALDLVFSLVWRVALAMLVLAAFDVVFQRRQHEKDLRMTRQEVRDELRSLEGDPAVKARIRQIQRQRARARMMEAVPNATVVVVNPTHFAVALEYHRERHLAPVVVAKGRDRIAGRIRDLAREHGVPIAEEPPLARELHKLCELGDEVPAHLYEAIARVLAYVLRPKTPTTSKGEVGKVLGGDVKPSSDPAAGSDER